MLLIDFGALWALTYLLVGRLNLIAAIGEKAALAFALALGLKSLMLFGWMASVGEFPEPLMQTGLSFGALVLVLILRRRLRVHSILPSRAPEKKSLPVIALVIILGILFLLSLASASFFPITEADGIWYHIKGMVFLHEGAFDSETIVSQFRQYPPFLSLLFAYLGVI